MPKPRPDGTKKCPMCQEYKLVEMFYKSCDGGYSSYCKPCTSLKNKQHRNRDRDLEYKKNAYNKNPEKYRELSRKNQQRMKSDSPAFYRAKKFFDGKRKEISAEITRQYLENLFLSTNECQCCGRKLELGYSHRSSRIYRSNPNAPSIDRVNNHKGYTANNIAVICWECNYRKTDLSKEDLIMFLNYIERCGDV